MYANQLNNICNGVAMELQYLQLCERYDPPLFKIFAQICSVKKFSKFYELLFPKNLLVAAANCFKVLKTIIPLKVTVYIQDRRLRSEKALEA